MATVTLITRPYTDGMKQTITLPGRLVAQAYSRVIDGGKTAISLSAISAYDRRLTLSRAGSAEVSAVSDKSSSGPKWKFYSASPAVGAVATSTAVVA